MFSKSEIKYLIVTILVMTLAFAFNDGQDTFVWSFWLKNFLTVLVIVTFSFLIHQLAHKVVARMNGFDTEYKWWGTQSRWWRTNPVEGTKRYLRGSAKAFPKKIRVFGREYIVESFPIGILLSLIVMFVSNGLAWFLAVGQYNLLLKKASRYGRRFVHVTEYEEAKIALAGPMSHIVIMTVFSFFNSFGIFDQVILINWLLALFYMLPIHQLDGTKIYFGSPLLYVSSLIFMISMIILVYNLSTIPMLIVSVVAACVAGALYYYYQIYR